MNNKFGLDLIFSYSSLEQELKQLVASPKKNDHHITNYETQLIQLDLATLESPQHPHLNYLKSLSASCDDLICILLSTKTA